MDSTIANSELYSRDTQLRRKIADHYTFQREYMTPQEYRSFIEFRVNNEKYQDQWITVLDSLIETLEQKNILDLGCGDGGFVVAMKKRCQSLRIQGCDVSIDNIELARFRAGKFGMAPELFTLSEGSHVPFPNEFFDVVVMFDVLEHASQLDQFLCEIARVLRPGGYFFSSTPNSLWPIESHLRLWFPHWMPKQLRRIYVGRMGGEMANDILSGVHLLTRRKVRTLLMPYFSECCFNDEIFLRKFRVLGGRGDSRPKALVKKAALLPPLWFLFRFLLRNCWPSIYSLARK